MTEQFSGSSVSGPPVASSVFQRWGRGGTAVVLSLAAVVMLLIGATIGLALGGSDYGAASSSTQPAANSVDVGFLRDMSVHHEQGVLLSHIVQTNGGSSEVAFIAYDIEYQQTSQIGQMGGFLQLWGYPLNNPNPPMAWMTPDAGHNMAGMTAMSIDPAAAAAGATMPGMATRDEIAELKTLRGAASDTLYLQLMIRHHQGGVPMMQYAATYATNPVVKNMASKMAASQVAEITSMTELLEGTFGAGPLPAPGASGSSAVGTDGTTTVPTSSTDGMIDMSGMEMAPTS